MGHISRFLAGEDTSDAAGGQTVTGRTIVDKQMDKPTGITNPEFPPAFRFFGPALAHPNAFRSFSLITRHMVRR